MALTRPIRTVAAAMRDALGNDGIRRLEAAWSLGIAADTGLLVVLLVVVYAREGVVAASVLGAVRMIPAVLSGMTTGAVLARFRGDQVLVSIGVVRATAAALCGVVILFDGPTLALFAFGAIGAAAGAPVRPAQATLMPAVARSPRELVAANMAWSTGEGLGSMLGPFIAGLFVAAGSPGIGALVAALAFLAASVSVARLRFEQAADAWGGAGGRDRGLRLLDGVRALRRRPTVGWTLVSCVAQVATRGLLAPLTVVAAIELLGMGEPGVGGLNAALGVGGLVGAVFAVGLTRTDRLVRTELASLAYWGVPIAVIALLPVPAVALAAMVVVGVANAVFDVAIFTIFQRGTANEERAPVFSVFEGAVGLGLVMGSLLAPVLIAAFGARGALAVTGAFLPIVALIIYSRIGRDLRVTTVDEPTVQLLRNVPIFAELPLTAIERLAGDLEPVAFDEGSVLMREGEPGDRFVVVADGEVEVSVAGRSITRLGSGDGVGEIALLRRAPRSATVTARTAVNAFAIPGACFVAAISGPAAAAVTERIADAHMQRGAVKPATEVRAAG